MNSETVFILLFVVAMAVAMAARRLRIPYTVGLVLAGILLGVLKPFAPPILTKDLLFSLFLPGLLFEAAFHLDFEQFRRNRLAIASLAVPGVVLATALTTLILVPVASTVDLAADFDWRLALVFAAMIAATDPIAVVAMFRSLGAPRRLRTLMEGESLLNDGTGIVFFTLSLSIVAGGGASAGGLLLDFLLIVGVGILIGGAVGLLVSQIIRNVDDAMIEITLTTIAAYGSFVLAEHLHYSGVIATVTAGMFCGNYGARTGMSPSTRIAAEVFWEYMAFALNSIVFLLLGFELQIGTLLASWHMILAAYAAMTLGRGLVVLGVSGLLRTTRERIPRAWGLVLTWGGLRGALPMVLVLSLPPGFSHRELLISMVFGIVTISILLQGLTMSPLLRRLGIAEGQRERSEYELARARVRAARAALEDLDHLAVGGDEHDGTLGALRREYEARIRENRRTIERDRPAEDDLRREELHWARRHLIEVEKRHVIEAYRRGQLNQDAYEALVSEIDGRLLRLDSGEEEPAEGETGEGAGDDSA